MLVLQLRINAEAMKKVVTCILKLHIINTICWLLIFFTHDLLAIILNKNVHVKGITLF